MLAIFFQKSAIVALKTTAIIQKTFLSYRKFKENAYKLTLPQCRTIPFELSALSFSFSVLQAVEENGNTPSTCLLLSPVSTELP